MLVSATACALLSPWRKQGFNTGPKADGAEALPELDARAAFQNSLTMYAAVLYAASPAQSSHGAYRAGDDRPARRHMGEPERV